MTHECLSSDVNKTNLEVSNKNDLEENIEGGLGKSMKNLSLRSLEAIENECLVDPKAHPNINSHHECSPPLNVEDLL
jgi:hypothetical protein